MNFNQKAIDNQSEPVDEDCERMAELAADPEAVAEADENWSGTLDGAQYSEMEVAFADLYEVDASYLIGSDLLTRMYRLAKVCADARTLALADMAVAA